jgi:penicillin-binding protein 2
MNQQAVTSKQLLTRRAVVFGAANVAAMGVILGRLGYLQFVRAEEYTTLAEGNRVKLQLLAPVRGLLLDCKGVKLADNQKNFRLFLDTEMTKDARDALKSLAGVIAISDERMAQVLSEAKVARYTPPILIKEHLTWDELSQFEFYRLNYPEVFVDIGQVRYYPSGENASHLIGYVGAVTEAEAKEMNEQELARLPDFKIGKSGVEKMLEATLRGTAGVKQTEVNVHGLAVRELSRKEGKPGKDTHLTIDSRLQEYAAARFGSESGAAVVMNVHNGDVLALVSMPGYDPNSFSKGITEKYWGELQANARNPLLNKAIAGQYPPGSTFKLAMALAALDAEMVDPESRIFCDGHFMLGNHSFTCWKPGGHGSVNLHTAIQQSCDVFFYTMAERLGIDRMAAMALKMGLGKITKLGLPGEKPGLVPDDNWKHTRYGQSWQGGDTINVGIGQGYILATPLQLAVMTARIANGGFAVAPRLVASGDTHEPKPLGLSENTVTAVQEGMNAVTNLPGGTAYGARITDKRFAMAGKTGTSQVRKLLRHGIDQNSLPWEERHHAWFVGYAPVAAPQYAAAVIVEHGGGGAAAAAPIVRDILLKIQSMDAGEPGPVLPEAPKLDKEGEID